MQQRGIRGPAAAAAPTQFGRCSHITACKCRGKRSAGRTCRPMRGCQREHVLHGHKFPTWGFGRCGTCRNWASRTVCSVCGKQAPESVRSAAFTASEIWSNQRNSTPPSNTAWGNSAYDKRPPWHTIQGNDRSNETSCRSKHSRRRRAQDARRRLRSRARCSRSNVLPSSKNSNGKASLRRWPRMRSWMPAKPTRTAKQKLDEKVAETTRAYQPIRAKHGDEPQTVQLLEDMQSWFTSDEAKQMLHGKTNADVMAKAVGAVMEQIRAPQRNQTTCHPEAQTPALAPQEALKPTGRLRPEQRDKRQTVPSPTTCRSSSSSSSMKAPTPEEASTKSKLYSSKSSGSGVMHRSHRWKAERTACLMMAFL